MLIAILLPAVSRAREAAKRAVCMSNVRQLAAFAINYAGENEGVFPVEQRSNALWLTPYAFRTDMFIAMGFPDPSGAGVPEAPVDRVWECPSNPAFGWADSRVFWGFTGWVSTSVFTSYEYVGRGVQHAEPVAREGPDAPPAPGERPDEAVVRRRC